MSKLPGGGAMIQGEQVVSLCLSACPELAAAWEEECRTWDLNPEDGMELKTPDTPYPSLTPTLHGSVPYTLAVPAGQLRRRAHDLLPGDLRSD